MLLSFPPLFYLDLGRKHHMCLIPVLSSMRSSCGKPMMLPASVVVNLMTSVVCRENIWFTSFNKLLRINFGLAIWITSCSPSFAQGSHDINSLLKKLPRAERQEVKIDKPSEPREKPENNKDDQSRSDARVLSSGEISNLGKEATTLILIYDNSGLSSLGSGFFISKSLVFTNSHVVEGNTRIDVITSDGEHHEGKVISISNQKAGKDFALLELNSPVNVNPLKLSTTYEQLMPVYAFGYPFIAISDDPNFKAIANGDMRVLPHIVVSSGTIQQIRDNNLNAEIIMHSAKIAGGNSGGPLLDGCGRVVGVNTYTMSEKAETQMSDGSKGETKIDTGYAFSISSEEISKFLSSRKIVAEFEKGRCSP